MRAPKTKKRLPTTLDADQMGAPAGVSGATIRLSARDKAIMELFYSSGLRLAELVGLDLSAIDLADRTVRVARQGRQDAGRADRAFAVDALRKWLVERAALAEAPALRGRRRPAPVFIGRRGGGSAPERYSCA